MEKQKNVRILRNGFLMITMIIIGFYLTEIKHIPYLIEMISMISYSIILLMLLIEIFINKNKNKELIVYSVISIFIITSVFYFVNNETKLYHDKSNIGQIELRNPLYMTEDGRLDYYKGDNYDIIIESNVIIINGIVYKTDLSGLKYKDDIEIYDTYQLDLFNNKFNLGYVYKKNKEDSYIRMYKL